MNRFINSFLLKSPIVLAIAIAILPAISTSRSNAEPASNSAQPTAATVVKVSTPTNHSSIASKNNTTSTVPVATPLAAKSLSPIADVNLVIQLNERKLYVYQGSQIVATYPVAIGRKGRETPTGEWQIMETLVDPGWTNFNTGKTIPPGKNNPLGSRWIGFWTDGTDTIGFHGTNQPDSIGKAVSSGCVRMYDKDVQALYPLVKVGTIVRVVN
jgi:lipoprotein-anchoring transpeptidase ErfK/SrfK